MHENLANIALATALAFADGSGSAMTKDGSRIECNVVGGGKLSKDSGGADALCRAISIAFGQKALKDNYKVEVVVLGPSRIAAEVVSADGQKLVERKYGSMDRELTSNSFERFAKGLATELSSAEH